MLWVTLAAVGPLPPVAALVIAYLVGYLANAIPVPGGIGVLDAGLVGALAVYGLPLTHAAAAVLVYHAIAFWVPRSAQRSPTCRCATDCWPAHRPRRIDIDGMIKSRPQAGRHGELYRGVTEHDAAHPRIGGEAWADGNPLHCASRTMARPGLEPGTPRFSVVLPRGVKMADLRVKMRLWNYRSGR